MKRSHLRSVASRLLDAHSAWPCAARRARSGGGSRRHLALLHLQQPQLAKDQCPQKTVCFAKNSLNKAAATAVATTRELRARDENATFGASCLKAQGRPRYQERVALEKGWP